MTTTVKKGDRVRASWFQSKPLGTFSVAGAQTKVTASRIEVAGTVRHVRGDDPVAPAVVRLFLDCDGVDGGARPPGCTCLRGHVEVRPEWVVAVGPDA